MRSRSYLKYSLRCFLLLLLPLLGSILSAEEEKSAPLMRTFERIETTELVLENGLRVLIKPHRQEKGEVNMQLIAPGGYSSLDKELRPSGMVAAKIALESGLGNYSANELSYILYRDTVDLHLAIEKNHRVAEISSKTYSLDCAFMLLRLLFAEKSFKEKAFEKVIKRERELIVHHPQDSEQNFESLFFSLNTQNAQAFRPLTLKALPTITRERAEQIFNRSFANPSEFTLVIVGDISLEKIIPLLHKQLSPIKNHPTLRGPSFSPAPSFPKGITRRIVPNRHKNQAFTRITLAIEHRLEQNTIELFDLASQLIEKRVRNRIKESIDKNFGIDVGYELPLYPNLEMVWMVIGFHSPKELVDKVEQLIIDELIRLKKEVVEQKELGELLVQQAKNGELLKLDGCYWQAKLANYSIWGWDIGEIDADKRAEGEWNRGDELRKLLTSGISPSDYTLISSHL